MKLSDLTVRGQLLAGFGSLVVIVTLLAGLALNALGRSNGDYERYVNEDAVQLTLANDVLDAANARAVSARNLVLATDASDRSAEHTFVKQAHERVTVRLSRLKSLVQSESMAEPRSAELLADIEKIESRYGPLALEIVNLAMSGQKELAISKINSECRPLLAALLKVTGAYIEHETAKGVQAVKEAQTAYAWSRNVLVGGCVLAITLAVLLLVLITRNLTRALGAEPSRLGEAARQVAAGNLAPIPEANSAWQGSVLASLGDMQRSLANVVGKVRSASDSIATASSEIATGTADLSQRTEEQASNLQQTAASMEQMNSTVKSNAETARQATQLAVSVSTVAEQGGQVVNRVVTTMDDITASSKRISDIISVIDGIAFQTNILALNAAVEAARAGEQGRGFAVVASEVRTLARRSADAAKEIKTLISDSVEKVDTGARLVNEAGAKMNEIVRQVRHVSDLIGEMGAATVEESKGVEQVTRAVTQLDEVTQQNAALVEESAAAADSLKRHALDLAKVVQVFSVQEDERRQAASCLPAYSPAQKPEVRKARSSVSPVSLAAAREPGWETF